jgi:hypothetical protein
MTIHLGPCDAKPMRARGYAKPRREASMSLLKLSEAHISTSTPERVASDPPTIYTSGNHPVSIARSHKHASQLAWRTGAHTRQMRIRKDH